jgi:hypothetical protein
MTMIFKALILTGAFALGACSQLDNSDSRANEKIVSSDELMQGSSAITGTPSTVKYDGPLGLKLGLTVSQVKEMAPDLVAADDLPGWYATANVPTPHPSFDLYMMHFSKKSGLCVLEGLGKSIKSGSSGTEVRLAFDELTAGVSQRYGHGKKYDFFEGAAMGDSRFWMMALESKNRTLAMSWDKETGATLPNTLSNVYVFAKALDIETGIINIQYEFSNVADCESEENEIKNKGL